MAYLEHGDGLGVESPVVPLLHDVLVGEVHHPTLLDCLRADSLRLKISSLSLSLVLAGCQQNIALLLL